MGRHSTTRATFTGTTERARLRGAAPRMYAGQSRAPARSGAASPLLTWAILLAVAVLVLVLMRI